jgi:hypothetical protein
LIKKKGKFICQGETPQMKFTFFYLGTHPAGAGRRKSSARELYFLNKVRYASLRSYLSTLIPIRL